MKITIVIDTEKSSDFEGKTRAATAKILRNLAQDLDYGEQITPDTKLPLFSSVGQTVGYLTAK